MSQPNTAADHLVGLTMFQLHPVGIADQKLSTGTQNYTHLTFRKHMGSMDD